MELEDETWFPAFLRDWGTDYLQFMINAGDAYRDLAPMIQKGLSKARANVVVDLAAGGGGGWAKLGPRLKALVPGVKVTLTDYFPHVGAFEALQRRDPELFSFRTEQVNALDVPADLVGLRTQFLSFHHFRPEQAQQILQNAVDASAPIMIVEVTERSVKQVVQFALSWLFVFFVTPFIKPFSLGRLFFTYIIPIMPWFISWDGIASAFRTYKQEEVEAMTQRLERAEGYRWEIGWHGEGMRRVFVALGYPS
jgi:hypothetical protein